MSIEKETFKQAMAQFATGVTIVTTYHQDTHSGITANAFCSVSLDPQLVLVSIAKRLFTHEQIEQSGRFAVNILTVQQMDWADRFAGRYPHIEDRFEGIDCQTAATGCRLLPGTLAWVDCEVRHAYDGGDHTLFVGEVMAGEVAEGAGEPLLYYAARWSQLAKEGPEAGSSWPGESAPKE